MTHLLNCPVCGYKEIEANTCPNCDTDISLIRSLTELSPINQPATQLNQPVSQKATKWQAGVALLMLLVGICLGALGSFLFSQQLSQPFLASNTSRSATVESEAKTPTASIAQASIKPEQPTQYTVKTGDNLTAITEEFCGKGKTWQLMVEANPQLKSRPNSIQVGELLKPPQCEG